MSSVIDTAQEVFEKVKNLSREDLQEALKLVPEEVQRAYWKLRKDSYFTSENAGASKERFSPSGKYKLVTTSFTTGGGSWNYTQGQVFAKDSDTPIATVRRNYSAFPYLFVEGHPNGHDYFVAGEDYQGQTVIELDTGKRLDVLPEAAHRGHGFCWGGYEWVPSMQALLVDGCYWACPYEFRFYDFADPMNGWAQIGEDVCIDEDRRKPELLPDGTIKVYQTSYRSDEEAEDDDEDAPEPLGPVAAFTIYRRDGLKLIEVESWVSEREEERRRKNKEAEERYEKWVANFKAADPLYLAMVEGIKEAPFSGDGHIGIGITYKDWCKEFPKEERRICRRILDKGKSKTGWTIDLEWGAETGPVKLVIYKDGATHETKFFMEHSVASMQAAFAYAKQVMSG